MRRILIAATVAPIAAAFIAALPAIAIAEQLNSTLGFSRPGEPSFGTLAGAYLSVSLITSALGLGVSLTLGLAWHAYASKRGWRSAAAYWAPGAIAGFALGLALIAAMFRFDIVHLWPCSIWSAGVGALAGTLAWRTRRPDRDAKAHAP